MTLTLPIGLLVTLAKDKHNVTGECLEARDTEMPYRQEVPMLH